MSRKVNPLAVILRHADSHRALSLSDGYSAQEAPCLEATYSAVAELVAAARLSCALDRVTDGLRAALRHFPEAP